MKVIVSLIGVASIVLCVNALPHKRAESDLRAEAIKDAFKHAWTGYSTYAYGHDELLPKSNKYSDSR
jgi:mannosyl-oligosaccharide alpha-1,2-mannosidase